MVYQDGEGEELQASCLEQTGQTKRALAKRKSTNDEADWTRIVNGPFAEWACGKRVAYGSRHSSSSSAPSGLVVKLAWVTEIRLASDIK